MRAAAGAVPWFAALALLASGRPAEGGRAPEQCGQCRCSLRDGDAPLLFNCTGLAAEAGAVPSPDWRWLRQWKPGPGARPGAGPGAGVALELRGTGARRLLRLPPVPPLQLHDLDLADNAIDEIQDNALSTLGGGLRRLSLARNKLASLGPRALAGLPQLVDLDLSDNGLPSLPLGALPAGLLRLVAARNPIATVEPVAGEPAIEIQELDLSDCQLSALSSDLLPALPQLRTLSLAGNPLRTVDAYWPAQRAPALASLDLSRCRLAGDLELAEHPRLQHIRLQGNLLAPEAAARLLQRLPQLKELQLADNGLDKFPLASKHEALQELNLSGNALAELPSPLPPLPALGVLDLSRNRLTSVPPALTEASVPALRRLFLGANPPFASLKMPGPLPKLRLLDASSSPQLQRLSPGDLKPLALAGGSADSALNCSGPADAGGDAPGLAVRLGGSAQLAEIQAGAFDGLPVCELDASGGALAAVAEGLLPWELLRVVDLQRNPWDCACEQQWLLERVVAPAYRRGRRRLLVDLKCERPASLRGLRLVHFYNWTEGALCRPPEVLERMRAGAGGAGGDGGGTRAAGYSLSASNGMLIAIGAAGAVLVFAVGAGICMHRQAMEKKRRLNRRL